MTLARSPEVGSEMPLAIDLCCGLGGWTEGLLAEGWRVRGYDIEAHEYGDEKYPAELVIADVLAMHGSEIADADLIVASPPCQAYSYMAMPWSLAKAKAAAIRADETGELLRQLNAIFDACFRIQREASEAAGRHIPMIVENVRGAQPWVGRAAWNFGSFFLWGDVPALMPVTLGRQVMKAGIAHRSNGATNFHGQKVPGFRFDGSGKSFQTASVEQSGLKGGGGTWFGDYADGIKQGGDWFNGSQPSISRQCSSKSKARKKASAIIAKIPTPLSRWIARVYKPSPAARAA